MTELADQQQQFAFTSEIKNTLVAIVFGVDKHEQYWMFYFEGKKKAFVRNSFFYTSCILICIGIMEAIPKEVFIVACVYLLIYLIVLPSFYCDLVLLRKCLKSLYFWVNFLSFFFGSLLFCVNISFDYRALGIISICMGVLFIMILDTAGTTVRKVARYGNLVPILVGVYFVVIISLGRVPHFHPIMFSLGDFYGLSSNPIQYSVAQTTLYFLITGVSFSIYNFVFNWRHPDEFRYISYHPKVLQQKEVSYMFRYIINDDTNSAV